MFFVSNQYIVLLNKFILVYEKGILLAVWTMVEMLEML